MSCEVNMLKKTEKMDFFVLGAVLGLAVVTVGFFILRKRIRQDHKKVYCSSTRCSPSKLLDEQLEQTKFDPGN